jgi:hypothetical protein
MQIVIRSLVVHQDFTRNSGSAPTNDIPIMASSLKETRIAVDTVRHLLISLGFVINEEKSELTLAQFFLVLGHRHN